MTMLGAGNSGSAKDDTMQLLDAAGVAGAGGAPFRIPIHTGGASATQGHRMVGGRGADLEGLNAGTYSGDTNQTPEVDYVHGANANDPSDSGITSAIGAWYSFSDEHRS